MFSRPWPLARCLFLVALFFASFARSQTTDGFNPFMVPAENQKVTAGSTWTIVWEPTPKYGSKVSISLLYGANVMDMEDGPVLGSSLNAKDGKFAWTIPSNLAQAACYGLKISLDSNPSTFEYSYGFQISFAKPVVVPATSAKPAVATAKPVTIKQASQASSNNPPQVATTLQTVISQVTKTSISSTVVILVSSASGAKPVTITESLTLSGSGGLTIVNTIITGFTTIADSISPTEPAKITNAAAETRTVSITALFTAGSPNQTGTTTNSTISPTGLSKGAKAGISISVIIVAIIVCVVAWLLVATHYKRQQIAMRRSHNGYGNINAKGVVFKEESPSIDLVPVPIMLPIPVLSDEERRELVNRRRAAELSGGDVVAISEKEGGEKDELEARRRAAKGVHELG